MNKETEHIKDLIEEINILLELLDDPKEDIPFNSILYNKEYKEKIIYNSNTTFEKELKDFKMVGNYSNDSTSDNIHYVNQDDDMCENGGLMGYKWVIAPRGVKVLRGSSLRGEDILLEFKNIKKSKKGSTHGT